jgi:hypothetical protein
VADPIKLYNLGERGVNLTPSPLHQEPGDLIQGQNAVTNPEGGLGGLAKRPGITALTAAPLAGAIGGLAHVPLPDPGANLSAGQNGIYFPKFGYGPDGFRWARSTDGVDFATHYVDLMLVELLLHEIPNVTDGLVCTSPAYCSLPGRLYFWSYHVTTYQAGTGISRRQGSVTAQLLKIPASQSAGAVAYIQGVKGFHILDEMVYFCTHEGQLATPHTHGRVFRFDPRDDTLLQIGPAWGPNAGEESPGVPWFLTTYLGRLWCATMGTAGAKVYWIRPGVDTTWTLEDTLLAATDLCYTDMAVYRGCLYVATAGVDPANAASVIVRKRTPGGTWSTVRTASAPALLGSYSQLVTYGDYLYCTHIPSRGADPQPEITIDRYDGTTWTNVKNLRADYLSGATNYVIYTGPPFLEGGVLFLPFRLSEPGVGNVILRYDGSTWANVWPAGTLKQPPFLGVLKD